MTNDVNDFAKGRFVEKATLPLGTDTILVVLLQATGLPAATTIKRVQFLASVLTTGTGTGVEANFTNYARTTNAAANIVITVNTSTDVTTLDIADQTWNAAGGTTNNTLGKLLICYKPTSSTPDTAIPILTAHDYSATTTGGNLTAGIPAVATAT